MKKQLYIVSALFLLLAISCTNDLEITMNEGQLTFSSINASMADLPTSRTHLENDGRVVWDVNDQVGIFSDTQTEPVQFTCTSVDNSKASFTSNDEVSGSKFFAFYPYEECEIEGNELTYTLSNNTQYAEGTYFRQCPMIAKSNINEFKFKHTCGIIRFSITGTQQIESLVLEGNNGEIIAGTGVVDLNDETPVLTIPVDATNASTTLTMSVGGLQLSTSVTDFYFIIPETEFTQGLNLTINYLDENSQVTSVKKKTQKSVSVSRSIMKSFSVFDADELIQEQEEERIYSALMAFYNATGGENWINNTNWGSDRPFDEWYGVDMFNNSIYNLMLSDNNLVGAVNDELNDFTELVNISFDNNKLTAINVSNNIKLKCISCDNNMIESLDLTNNVELEQLICRNNYISELDFANNPLMTTIWCNNNQLTTLDISICTRLETLICFDNKIETLDVAKCCELTYLCCNNNKISVLDVSKCAKLETIVCDENQISVLDVARCTELIWLTCPYNQISALDVTNCTKLYMLDCCDNLITKLDVTKCTELMSLACFINKISFLDVTNCTKLVELLFTDNKLENIDISNCTELVRLWCDGNLLTSLDVSSNLKLDELYAHRNPHLSTIYISPNQWFGYEIDDWTIFSVVGNEDNYYVSTDYSKDGEVSIIQKATKGRGIDIVIMGDAFSDRLIADGTYENTMKLAIDNFFSVEPYKSHRDFFNVYSVNAVSTNEEYGFTFETALSGYFGTGTHVGGDDQKVFNYALKAINEEQIDETLLIVIMNNTTYAGTCYMYSPNNYGDYGNGVSISYFPIGEDKAALEQVLHHEACGHGFAKLADEYADEYMGEVPSDYVTGFQEQYSNWGWWKNVDFTNDASNVRWSKFLFDTRYANDGLGLYEGGLTYWTGVWRPTENSIMRYNTGGFNAPSREAIYYRIHKLAYGEDWEYDYEKFVEYDAINRNSAASRSVGFKQMPPLHKPVIVNSSWKNAKSNVFTTTTQNAYQMKDSSKYRSVSKVTLNSSLTQRASLSHRTLLSDGRTIVTSIDADGKTKVEYVNVK